MRRSLYLKSFVIAFGVAASLLGFSSVILASGSGMQNLGTLPTGLGSEAYGINRSHDVVGWGDISGGTHHAVLWTSSGATDLGTLGGSMSYAYAINNKNQVVGTSTDKSGKLHAFLWQNAKMTNIGSFTATAINNHGEVVGFTGLPSIRAVVWNNGKLTDLGTFGGPSSVATGINDSGQVVGASDTGTPTSGLGHAYLWTNGHMKDLGTLGGNESTANGINISGEVVGWSDLSDGEQHAFIYKNGKMTDLGQPGLHSIGTAINNKGQVAGYSDTPSSSSNFAVVWNNLSPTFIGVLPGGLGGSTAAAINNAGYIAGTSSSALGGGEMAFLYKP